MKDVRVGKEITLESVSGKTNLNCSSLLQRGICLLCPESNYCRLRENYFIGKKEKRKKSQRRLSRIMRASKLAVNVNINRWGDWVYRSVERIRHHVLSSVPKTIITTAFTTTKALHWAEDVVQWVK